MSAVGPLDQFATLPVWVAWQTELRKDGTRTKVPYSPRRKGKAQSNNPATWGTLDQAMQRASSLPKPFGLGGVGVMLAPLSDGTHLGGIDLDTCRDPQTGAVKPWAQEIIDRIASYAEVSPSQTGLKIFFRYDPAVAGGVPQNKAFRRSKGDHPPAIEFYLNGQYFTVTGEQANGIGDLRVVPTDDLQWLVTTAGPAFDGSDAERARDERSARPRDGRTLTLEDLASAYGAMANADLSGQEWVERGTALKAAPGDDGEKFKIFDGFSQRSEKYNEAYTHERWRKFKPNGRLGTGSIIHWARQSDSAWWPPSWQRPEIMFDPTDPKRMAREGEAVLIENGVPLYQQTGKLVHIVRQGKPTVVQSVTRPAGAVVLVMANPVWLSGEFTESARWMLWDARKKELKAAVLPRRVAEHYLEMRGEWQVSELVGTVETPTLYRNGNGYALLQTPGYDAASGLYYVPSIDFPPIPLQPSREDAVVALGLLLSLVEEFPFVPDDAKDDWQPGETPGSVASASRSVFLSAVLTGMIRRSMNAAPMHIFDANSPGTGKSYLVIIISVILIGREPGAVPWVSNEEEARKRILAVLLAGDPVFRFDNIDKPLGGPALNILLSERTLNERVLGKSMMADAPTNVLVLATGNNVEVEADTTRRTVRSRMDARHERPQDRKFRGNPLAEATERRGELVVAGLTILLAYLHAGCPGYGEINSVGGYEDWTLIRGALAWLDQPDPADTMKAISDDDPERDEIQDMMLAWDGLFAGRGAVKLAEVMAAAKRGADKYGNNDTAARDLFDAIHPTLKGAPLSSERLGHWFKKQDRKIVGGRCFVRSGDANHGRKVALLDVNAQPDLVREAEEGWET